MRTGFVCRLPVGEFGEVRATAGNKQKKMTSQIAQLFVPPRSGTGLSSGLSRFVMRWRGRFFKVSETFCRLIAVLHFLATYILEQVELQNRPVA